MDAEDTDLTGEIVGKMGRNKTKWYDATKLKMGRRIIKNGGENCDLEPSRSPRGYWLQR